MIAWDEAKNKLNQRKHEDISFEMAQLVFDDPLHVTRQDRDENGELRWQTFGMVGNVLLLLVAHTLEEHKGEEVIRIISARRATKSERKIYEQGY